MEEVTNLEFQILAHPMLYYLFLVCFRSESNFMAKNLLIIFVMGVTFKQQQFWCNYFKILINFIKVIFMKMRLNFSFFWQGCLLTCKWVNLCFWQTSSSQLQGPDSQSQHTITWGEIGITIIITIITWHFLYLMYTLLFLSKKKILFEILFFLCFVGSSETLIKVSIISTQTL